MIISGEMVKAARREKGWSQKTLGVKIGMSRPNISILESSREVSIARLAGLDKVFGGKKWRSQEAASSGESGALQAIMDKLAGFEAKIAALERAVKARK